MVQDSVVDQRSEDGNNKLRGAVVVEIAKTEWAKENLAIKG